MGSFVNDLFDEALGEGLKSKIRGMEQLFLGKAKMPNKSNRKPTCHNYNNEGYFTRSNCRFGHCCQYCGGSHPRKLCRKWLNQRQGNQNPPIHKEELHSLQIQNQQLSKNNTAIVTTIIPTELDKMLKEYNSEKVKLLVDGFTFGFRIPYNGNDTQRLSKYLRSATENLELLD